MSTSSTTAPSTASTVRPESRSPGASNKRGLLAALIGIPLLAVVLLSAFAWPASTIAPRDLPIGVTGPPPAVAAVEGQLAELDGAFTVTAYDDVESAESAIRGRDIYGVIAVGTEGSEVLTATAASPVVAQLLGEIARDIGQAQGSPVGIRDIVTADPDDPRGSGLAASILPLIILGIAIGAIATLLTRDSLGRIAVVGVGALTAGLAGVALSQGWLGLLGGDWWLNAGVLALVVGSIGVTVAGLGALLGEAGIGLGAAIMVLLGNPLSGVTSAPELLSQPWGAVGQALPPGAGATLLRSTAFFDGAGAAVPAWTLLAWWIVGGTLLSIAALRGRRSASIAA